MFTDTNTMRKVHNYNEHIYLHTYSLFHTRHTSLHHDVHIPTKRHVLVNVNTQVLVTFDTCLLGSCMRTHVHTHTN